MNYTKGPWKVHSYYTRSGHNLLLDVGPRGLAVAQVIGAFENFDNLGPESEANAQLIAAAPELYEFAKIMQKFCNDNPGWAEDFKIMCDHALKKAEGK